MYTLRESNEDDFEFVFQLNRANVQKYVQMLLMVLNVNPAKRLYERLGFRTVEEIDTGQKGIKCRMEAAAS